MHTWDINAYKGRLLGALQAYELKVSKRGGVHPLRVRDIRVLRDCIHSIYDPALLNSELQVFLSKMFIGRTWSAYFWGQPRQSELKRMLEVVMADEQAKTAQLEQMSADYHLYQQVLASSKVGNEQGGARHKYDPADKLVGESRAITSESDTKAISWYDQD